MKTILLVTWIVLGQPPSSYQVEFDSPEKCGDARKALIAEQRRLGEERKAQTVQRVPGYGTVLSNPGPPPQLTAICVAG
jgi:hypothetical protein